MNPRCIRHSKKLRQNRGFEVKREFPLPTQKKGTPPKIDFVIVNRRKKTVIAIELKYRSSRKMAGSISADASKLANLSIETLEDQIKSGRAGRIKKSVSDFKLTKAVVVAWHLGDILAQVKVESPVIQEQFLKLAREMVPEDPTDSTMEIAKCLAGKRPALPVGGKLGSMRPGSTITRRRFWVAAFFYRANWKKIT